MFPRGFPTHNLEHPFLLPTPVRIGASPLFTGRGVTIAFIDSGFYPHPDLGDRVALHVDASIEPVVVNDARYRRPMWYSWHGMMTSVIACGDGRTSNGFYRGVAPDARLILIKVSTPHKEIKECDILRGMNWLIANGERLGVKVVNISVGGDHFSDDPEHPLYVAVRALIERGISVVVAGGNSPDRPLVPPNSAPEAIAVGGYDDHNTLDYTRWQLYRNSFGTAHDGTPKPDLVAPAQWIASPILPHTLVEREARWLSALLDLAADDQEGLRRILHQGASDLALSGNEVSTPSEAVHAKLLGRIREHKIVDAHYQYVEGTSVAAAIVSGIIAQMLEVNSSLTPPEVKAILIETAKRIPESPHVQQGAGVINAAGAVALADAIHPRRK